MTAPGISPPDFDDLLAEVRACRACAGDLPHDPRPVVRLSMDVRILICGQAPGRRVHESGLPFDDPSGDRLRDWLGVDRATFYDHPAFGVAPMAFCYPGTALNGGGDYPPPPRCAALWRARLFSALPRVALTLLIGGYAQRWSLGDQFSSVDASVAAWREHPPWLMCLPHPSWRNAAWLRRHPWFEQDVVPTLRRRVADILDA